MSQRNMIALLCMSAFVLVLANYVLTPPAQADTVVKDRQYQMCTVVSPSGDDALFILNNQTGMLSCYSYDPTARLLVNRASQPVMQLFTAPNGQMPPR